MRTLVVNCARCGLTHKDLPMRKFRRPPPDATHFAICPKYKEPILIKVEVKR